ncbi:hypothetical protein EIN_044250 [Entamoeba invadens IP1]|uniref:Uncharacterized protein n=1 Tax=Entamoeba invadens IP1 TaxID=370355 RepID=A0A0A1TZ70_ENTIV|nr:hypothetical protein EIN_044250 [Entamoeba invadens IP1]ELP86867.1 hypothetical protein EIN_044250 [Entamoeba invadens IP1]|eukprot:XP_004253638.1 hypothetical protein EIN_044250 [Entamoeba invadens IP1]
MKSLRETSEYSRMSIGDLVDNTRNYQAKLSELTVEVLDLKTKLDSEEKKRQSAESALMTLQKEHDKMYSISKDGATREEQLNSTVTRLTSENECLKEKLMNMTEKVEEQSDAINVLKSELSQIKTKNEKEDTLLLQIQHLSEKLDTQHQSSQSFHSLEIQKVQESIEKVENEVKRVQMTCSPKSIHDDYEVLKERLDKQMQLDSRIVTQFKEAMIRMKNNQNNIFFALRGALDIQKEVTAKEIIHEVFALQQKKALVEMDNSELKRELEKTKKELDALSKRQKYYGDVLDKAEEILKQKLV